MAYSKKITCEKSNLKVIREFSKHALEQFHVPQREAHMIVLAIEEVCANMIIHTHHCDPSDDISIFLDVTGNRLIVEIHDKAQIFDIPNYTEPMVDKIIKENKNGGLGLILVKRIMDEIQVLNGNEVNICRMFKNVPAQPFNFASPAS